MPDPLKAIIDAIGNAVAGKECFNGDEQFPPPVYINGGWLVPSWLSEHPEQFKCPEVVAYLVRVGFLNGDDNG